MCTALSLVNGDFYFGRNMDIAYSFLERVVFTPRNFAFAYKKMPSVDTHYAMVGMACVQEGYPLYAEAINEKGLGMAGLNFPEYAHYADIESVDKDNITPYEFIPWILGGCKDMAEAKLAVEKLSLIAIPFSQRIPLAPLHWIISDKTGSIVVEQTSSGLKIHDNPTGIMTNNPQFDFHMTNLSNYLGCSPYEPQNHIYTAPIPSIGHGFGGVGLPGDNSTCSRFVRAVFAKGNSVFAGDCSEGDNIAQFFHILENVAVVRGATRLTDGTPDYTTYASCANADKGIYYYKTYGNSQITAVKMHAHNLDDTNITEYTLITEQQIRYQN